MKSLEQTSDLSILKGQELIEDSGILYRIADKMMRIRKTITGSQPKWYIDCGL